MSFSLLKEGENLKWFKKNFLVYKVVITVFSIVVATVLVGYSVSSISFGHENRQTVEIIDIVHNGSYAGTMDYYSLYVRDTNGTVFWISTPIFANKNFIKQFENLQIFDTITIIYVKNTQVVYRLEEQNADG